MTKGTKEDMSYNTRKASFLAVMIVAVLYIFFYGISDKAYAKGQISGMVFTLQSDADAYSEKSTESTLVKSFSKGDAVFVTEIAEKWVEIMYAGETAYLPTEAIASDSQQAEARMEEMSQALTEEFEDNQSKEDAYVDILQRKERTEKNANLWKTIIVVLVGALIVISVFYEVKRKKKPDKEDT